MEFFKESEFQKTEIGRIPKDWNVESLKNVADVKGGKRLPKGDKLVEYETPFPYIRILDFTDGKIIQEGIKYLHSSTQKKISRYIISSDDVYISIAGTIGLAGLIPKKLDGANLTENAAKLCNLRKVEKTFLAYSLNSAILQSQIKALIGKGSQPKLALFRIEKLLVPVPSFSEQKNISRFLSLVDRAIDISDVIIKKNQELKKGLMQELLTKGIGNKKFKYSEELGCKIPKEWRIAKLEAVALDMKSGGTPSTKRPDYWNGEIPWTTSERIVGRILSSGQKLITSDGLNNSATNIIPEGNILVATRVGIGKAAINSIDIAISQDLTGIIVDRSKIDSEFLYWIIMGSDNKLRSLAQGSTIKGILRNDLGKLWIPLPDIAEQHKIASILTRIDVHLETEIETKHNFEKLKKGLMQILLTGQVRIKVN